MYDRRKLVCCYYSFARPELTCGKVAPLQGSPLFYLPAELHFLFTCEHVMIPSYLICSSCLLAVCASCGPFRVRAGGWGCQFCRDALGASLPPRARYTRAEPAALHIRYTLVGCHRHLQGRGSLSETQTHKTEQGFKLTPMFMPLTTSGREKEWVVCSGNKQLNPYKHGGWPTQLQAVKGLGTTAIIICKFTIRGAVWGALIKPEQQITFYHSLSLS